MAFIRIGRTRTAAPNRCCPICSASWRCGGSNELPLRIAPSLHRNCRQTLHIDRSRQERSQGGILSQSQFLNRQALHLRPDPARVVVRPFRPAIEPRDLNPFERSKANHIVDRVLRLDPDAASRQMAEVLENFEGRHRNLIEIFETRAAEMEAVIATARGTEPDAAPADRGLFSERVFVRGVGAVQSEHRAPPRSDRRAEKWLPVHSEPSRRRRRPYLVADFSLRQHRGGRQRHRRSGRASRVGPQGSESKGRAQWPGHRHGLQRGQRAQRTRDLSANRSAIEWHRGRALRRVR